MNIKQATAIEITQLHQFFQDWFNGKIPPTQVNFSRFTGILDPNFKIIPPSGQIIHRKDLLDSVWKSHHSHSDIRIWIKEIQIQRLNNEIFLALYKEWQEIDRQESTRQSSALFRLAESTPNGVLWIQVQETWIAKP